MRASTGAGVVDPVQQYQQEELLQELFEGQVQYMHRQLRFRKGVSLSYVELNTSQPASLAP